MTILEGRWGVGVEEGGRLEKLFNFFLSLLVCLINILFINYVDQYYYSCFYSTILTLILLLLPFFFFFFFLLLLLLFIDSRFHQKIL